MESRELFLSFHLLPFLSLSRVGSDKKKKAPLSLSLPLSLILLPGFSSYKQIQCSSSSMLAVLTPSWLWFQRGVLSQTPFFNPGEEGWSGGEGEEEEGGGGVVIHLRPSLKSMRPRVRRRWRRRAERNGSPHVSWRERRRKRQLWHLQRGLQATALRDETDQTLNAFPQLCSDSSLGILLHPNEILFWVRPPEVASNYIQICAISSSPVAVYLFKLLNPIESFRSLAELWHSAGHKWIAWGAATNSGQ